MLSRRELERFEALSFDCYGTLVDWERGILAALKTGEESILEEYARAETELEAGPYRPYREVLRGVAARLGAPLDALADSVKDWPPFPDTVEALGFLERRYKLCVLSNVDRGLFEATERRLGIQFALVVTAEDVASYKPAPKHFMRALEELSLPSNKVLHVAQSLYHDIVPAQALGWSTVRVNRRKGKKGAGATPAADATPDLEVPDLASLVARLR